MLVVHDVVGDIRQSTSAMMDAQGIVWEVFPDDAKLGVLRSGWRAFTQAGCAGAAYIVTEQRTLPRYSILVPTSAGLSYRVITDQALSKSGLTFVAYDGGATSACQDSPPPVSSFSGVYLESETRTVTTPDINLTAPLRIEAGF
jgi:hypothetical protein